MLKMWNSNFCINTFGDLGQKHYIKYKCVPNEYALLFAGTHRGSDFITIPALVKK